MGHEQPIADADVEGPIRHKLTVEEFLILDEAGVFDSKHMELIDGEIFGVSPTYRPHARVLAAMMHELVVAVRKADLGLIAFSPVSTRLDDHNLLEPDLTVAVDDGGDGFLARESIRIALEVSSSTLRYDLVKKAELYARFAVPEYWVVDVNERRVIRMFDPIEGAYAERSEFAFGTPVPSATIPGLVVDTASL